MTETPHKPDNTPLPEPNVPPAFEEHLRRQRSRIRLMRVVLIVLALMTGACVALSYYVQNKTLTPGQTFAAAASDDRGIALTHTSNLTHMSTNYHVIAFDAENEQAATSSSYKGNAFDIALLPDQRVAVFLSSLAVIYPEFKDDDSNWPGEGEALPYFHIPTKHAAFCPSHDGVLVAWVQDGKLSCRLAGDGTSATPGIDIPDFDGRIMAFDLGSIGDSYVAAFLDDNNHLFFLTFDVEHGLLENFQPSAPSETSEDGASEDDSESAASNDGDDAENTGSAATTTSSDQPSVAPRKAYMVKNLKLKAVEGSIKRIGVLSSPSRAFVYYLDSDKNAWLGSLYENGEWLPSLELGALTPSPQEDIPTPKPMLSLTDQALYNFDIGDDGTSITRRKTSLVPDADNQITWEGLESWQTKEVKLPLDTQTLLTLTILFLTGTIVCMVWLGLNREQDVERALNAMVRAQVGRDTKKLSITTSLAPVDRIMWAGPIRRALALFVDVLVSAVLIVPIILARDLDVEKAINLWPQEQSNLFEGLTERLITLLVIAIYAFICEVRFGQTLGKALLGMRVVTADGKRPGLVALFIRNLVRAIELAHPFLILIGTFCILLTRRNQRIGDVLSGTAVKIKVDEEDDDDTSIHQPMGK